MAEISDTRLVANGVEFTCLTLGDGPLALCLQGFSDSAHTWRHVMPRLADAERPDVVNDRIIEFLT